MGLFDDVSGMISGAMRSGEGGEAAGAAAGPVGALGGLIGAHDGGLPGMIGAFEQAGLGGVVRSWISSEANQGITGDQVRAVLGDGPVEQFAERLGITPDMAAQQISQLLPQVVDHLTPDGAPPPAGGDALSSLLNSFKH